MKHSTFLALVVSLTISCGDAPTTDETCEGACCDYTCVERGDLTLGDPERGRAAFLQGPWNTCGIPSSVAARLPISDDESPRLEERTGANAELPYYLTAADSPYGVEVAVQNCLRCHASQFMGELVIGLGDSRLDDTAPGTPEVMLASRFAQTDEERLEMDRLLRTVRIADNLRADSVGVSVGTTTVLALAAYRDPATMEWLSEPGIELPGSPVPMDIPPLWNMAKKSALFANMAIPGDFAHWAALPAFSCTESNDEVEELLDLATDVVAWLVTLEPPAWPRDVDDSLASEGQLVFEQTCARCHGTYGADWTYDNVVVPLETIGTDSTAITEGEVYWTSLYAYLEGSVWDRGDAWAPQRGYVAPPLDGIWASAPFLHNGSVPTLSALLESSSRPDVWRRVGDTNDEDTYDWGSLGWRVEVLDARDDGETSVYDTGRAGYGNTGHTFGDALSSADRTALLEYLKTL